MGEFLSRLKPLLWTVEDVSDWLEQIVGRSAAPAWRHFADQVTLAEHDDNIIYKPAPNNKSFLVCN